MNTYLGIDIGGSKSHALLADENGRAISLGAAGPGNWEVVGYTGFKEALHEIVQQAIDRAGIKIEEIKGAGFGVCGYDWPSQLERQQEIIQSLGLTCPYAVVNDALVGLLAGSEEGWGLAVVAGTGCNCWGRDEQGKVGRIIGEGYLFDEEGGSGSLITRAIQSIARQWTLRGPATALSEAFVAAKGVPDAFSLFEGLALSRIALTPDDVRIVFRVAAEGDAVAQEIVAWAGQRLADLAGGVIRQLKFETRPFDLVLVGSLWKGGNLIRESFTETVKKTAPQARIVSLACPPVIGGVVLGMQQNHHYQPALRHNLMESSKDLC